MRRRAGSALPATPAATAGDRIDSLQRGLEVLRSFRPGEGLLGVGDIAGRLGLPRATTRRLLDTLTTHGFLLRSPGEASYGLHVASFVVGQAVLNGSPMVRHAHSILQSLADRFQGHAMLCVGDRLDMLLLAHRAGAGAHAWAIGPGCRLPIADTAAGRAWLWAQPAAVQSHWMAHLRESGAREAAEVWKAFHHIEADGTCETTRTDRRPATMVAAPVVLRDGATAVIACECLLDPGATHSRGAGLAPALLEAASLLREQVGHPGG
jgi:DNA-binding IclR family transcriptional regulator